MNGLIMTQSHVRMRQNRTESRSNFLSQVSRHPQGKILCCLGLGRESIFKVQVRKQLHATTCHRTVHAFNKPFKGQGDPCKKPVAPKNFHHVDCWLPTFHLFCVINHNTVLNVGGGCCHYCYRFSARLIIWTRGFTARIIQWKLLGVSSRGLLPHRLLCMICPPFFRNATSGLVRRSLVMSSSLIGKHVGPLDGSHAWFARQRHHKCWAKVR